MKIRLKRISISPDALMNLFKKGSAWRVSKGLPADSRIRGFTIDSQTQTLQMFIESKTFEEVSPYNLSPLHEVEFEGIK